MTMTLDRRITRLTGETRNGLCAGDVVADAVRAVLPVVKWTLNGFADYISATKISPHVRTRSRHNCNVSTQGAEGNQLPAENPFRVRFRQISGVAKPVPRSGICGKK